MPTYEQYVEAARAKVQAPTIVLNKNCASIDFPTVMVFNKEANAVALEPQPAVDIEAATKTAVLEAERAYELEIERLRVRIADLEAAKQPWDREAILAEYRKKNDISDYFPLVGSNSILDIIEARYAPPQAKPVDGLSADEAEKRFAETLARAGAAEAEVARLRSKPAFDVEKALPIFFKAMRDARGQDSEIHWSDLAEVALEALAREFTPPVPAIDRDELFRIAFKAGGIEEGVLSQVALENSVLGKAVDAVIAKLSEAQGEQQPACVICEQLLDLSDAVHYSCNCKAQDDAVSAARGVWANQQQRATAEAPLRVQRIEVTEDDITSIVGRVPIDADSSYAESVMRAFAERASARMQTMREVTVQDWLDLCNWARAHAGKSLHSMPIGESVDWLNARLRGRCEVSKHPGTLSLEEHQKGCDENCEVHFGCDCGKYVTVCRGGWARFPNGHGEDMMDCGEDSRRVCGDVK